jgi:hypothetical protein
MSERGDWAGDWGMVEHWYAIGYFERWRTVWQLDSIAADWLFAGDYLAAAGTQQPK